ncbi:Ankyrin repeat family protein [Melia azedarach]|uniref:Ankyrin repeat family protein n=1 Tax=Melia azedarach TaxID=155640 RepID=A0ACC1Y1C7_MELAZ|nr:Ankyrin repeat family protein [Melia azedarach]
MPLRFGVTTSCICVCEHNQLEAMKFLLERSDDKELLNTKNDYGKTILHLAAAHKQIEAIKFLTRRTTLEVNALNANGIKALDILTQSKRDLKDSKIQELLQRAGVISAKDIQLSANELCIIKTNNLATHDDTQKQQDKGVETVHNKEDNWLEKKSNTLMVVASLIATMAFQACVTPPDTRWKGISSRVYTYDKFLLYQYYRFPVFSQHYTLAHQWLIH